MWSELFRYEACGVRLVRNSTPPFGTGMAIGSRSSGRSSVEDHQESARAARVVPEDAAFVGVRDHVEAAVLEGGVDQGDPAGDDQLVVAVAHEVAAVLVPRDGAALEAGGLGAEPVDARPDDLGADDRFDGVEQPRVGEQVVCSGAHELPGALPP